MGWFRLVEVVSRSASEQVGWWVGGLVGWWVGGLVGWWADAPPSLEVVSCQSNIIAHPPVHHDFLSQPFSFIFCTVSIPSIESLTFISPRSASGYQIPVRVGDDRQIGQDASRRREHATIGV